LNGYVLKVWKARPDGRSVLSRTFFMPPTKRSLTLTLLAGRYRFAVAASNAEGTGPRSARTAWIRPR
jgi:hypothetical protein